MLLKTNKKSRKQTNKQAYIQDIQGIQGIQGIHKYKHGIHTQSKQKII